MAASLTTTTLFADPTFLGSSAPEHTTVPIGAIAGGCTGGVALALLAVLGWMHWGRTIKKREQAEAAKRKAIQAAIAHRRSVLRGSNSSRPHSRPRPSRPPDSSSVRFAAVAPITSPRPLRPIPARHPIPPVPPLPPIVVRPTFTPLRPSPLARPHSPPPSASPVTAIREKQSSAPHPPSASGRIPRIKASLSSLTGDARSHSETSQNTASDQSRHSSAGGSGRRWSWWSLINGPGVAFRQVGVGTGRNRLSADTSLYTDWQDEDPSLPVGFASSGLEDGTTADDQNEYVFLDSARPGQLDEKKLPEHSNT